MLNIYFKQKQIVKNIKLKKVKIAIRPLAKDVKYIEKNIVIIYF